MSEGGSVNRADENGFLSDLQAWEQWPGEPPRAYHVFELYCNLGHERSVTKAVAKWYVEQGQKPPANPSHKFFELATKWRWVERSADYWRRERRRGEIRLQERRAEIDGEIADLGKKLIAKLVADFSKLKPETSPRSYVDTLLKAQELIRIALHDDEDERKRKGRPREDDGPLPAIEDRLKPPEDEEPKA